jgi:hypothetical protein
MIQIYKFLYLVLQCQRTLHMTGEMSLAVTLAGALMYSCRHYTTVAQPGLDGRSIPYPRGMHDEILAL